MAVASRSQTSPDGTLTLEVYEAVDLVGFKGEDWHTHGELLVPEYGRTAREARDAFFDSVVADGVVICVNVERESPRRIAVTDDPEGEVVAAGQEAIVLRLWSGKVVGGTPRA